MTDPSKTTDSEHQWFAGHLAAGAVGLLDDAEQTRFDAHRLDCTDCQARWLAALDHDEDGSRAHALDAGHVASAILARWPQAGARLRGVERETVSSHVDACPQCRADLALLGYQPRWEPVRDGAAGAEPSMARRPGAGRSLWVPWLWGGISGAAVTAAVLLLALPIGGPARVGPAGGPQPPPAGGAPVGGGGVLPWVAPLSGRGTLATVELPADARELVITAATPMDADPSAPLEFEVLDPAGVARLQGRTTAGQTDAGALVLLLRSADPLPAGNYRVMLRAPAADGSGAVTSALRFELRRAPAR